MSRMLRPRNQRRPLRLRTAVLGPWRTWEACLKARLLQTATVASLALATLGHDWCEAVIATSELKVPNLVCARRESESSRREQQERLPLTLGRATGREGDLPEKLAAATSRNDYLSQNG